jgi:hypothetical protein
MKKAARWLNLAAFVVAYGGGWLTTLQLSIHTQTCWVVLERK